MGYLRYHDYAKQIQDLTFQQIIASNQAYRIAMERAAQAEMVSFLVQKYDTDKEFKDTTVFDNAVAYNAGSLVEFTYPAWSIATTYIVGTFVTYNSKVYRCTVAPPAHQNPTDVNYWVEVTTQYDLYYLALPYDEFNVYNVYSVGDKVFWKNKIYQCKIATVIPDHYSDLQFGTYANQPLNNVFPDNPVNGPTYWGTGVSYSVTGLVPNGTPPAAWSSVTTYAQGQRVTFGGKIWEALANSLNKEPGTDITLWQSETWTLGDNRNQQLVIYMVFLVIYYLANRIAYKNIPQQWRDNYKIAKDWLQDAVEGNVTVAIPEKQPYQGARIRFGGNQKQINGY